MLSEDDALRFDGELAKARMRLRNQITVVRMTRSEGGDLALAMKTLRCLRSGYSVLLWARQVRASTPLRARWYRHMGENHFDQAVDIVVFEAE